MQKSLDGATKKKFIGGPGVADSGCNNKLTTPIKQINKSTTTLM